MFIAITPYRALESKDINHFLGIANYINYLLMRTPMSFEESSDFLNDLINNGFPGDKILIHSDMDLMETFDLNAIHFREGDENAFDYKRRHPEISVSMSTHSARSIEAAGAHDLNFILFGHIFETASKKGRPPRSMQEVTDALAFKIPVIALGGINERTISQLPKGFSGIAAISYFMDADPSEMETLRKEWERSNLM